jgi:hypothetical protein
MSNLVNLSNAALAEVWSEFAETVEVTGVGTFQAAWQDQENGKSLASDSGFALDDGGQIVFRLTDLTVAQRSQLDGKQVKRVSDGILRKIKAPRQTRITVTCDLVPITKA